MFSKMNYTTNLTFTEIILELSGINIGELSMWQCLLKTYTILYSSAWLKTLFYF